MRFDSRVEEQFYLALESAGVQLSVHPKGLFGRPDFVDLESRVAVFVHGCHWHRHASCSTARQSTSVSAEWVSRHNRQVERDEQVRKTLRKDGWRIAIVWECSMKRDAETVITSLKHHLHFRDADTASKVLVL